jgi:hypothetical protein
MRSSKPAAVHSAMNECAVANVIGHEFAKSQADQGGVLRPLVIFFSLTVAASAVNLVYHWGGEP